MEKMHSKENLLVHAKKYLDRGFSIIPVGYDKRPTIKSWKYYQSNKPTLEEVKAWFLHGTATGIAIITGKISNLIVLDFEHDAVIPELPDTVVAKSGGGGKHFYFKYPEGVELPNVVGLNSQPIDVRSNGGYIIAPPSLHKSGNHYEWEIGFEKIELAEFPEHWIDIIQDRQSSQNKTNFNLLVNGVEEGGRNDAAAKLIGKLLHHIPDQNFAWPLVHGWNLLNKPPLPLNELQSVFSSIAKKHLQGSKEVNNLPLKDPIHISELFSQPDEKVEWVIKDLIAVGSLNMISAPPKSFKTWTILHIASRVANGQKVFNWFDTSKSNVLIVDEEDAPSILKSRLKMLNASESSNIYFWIQTGFKIDNPQHLNALLDFIVKKDIKLVNIDSFRRVQMRDENSAKEVAEVFEEFRKISKLGVAVLITHHHRKQGILGKNSPEQNIRGSSDILASLDGHLVVDRNYEDHALTIDQNKQRVIEEMRPFKVKIIKNDRGLLSLEYDGEIPVAKLKKEEGMELIVEFLVNGEQSRSAIDLAIVGKIGKSAIGEALKELVKSNRISERREGRGKKFYFLPIKES